MSNEHYLVVSYFIIGSICFVLTVTVYVYLRTSFSNVASLLPNRHLSNILRKLFFLGMLLPALFGFFSVSFKGCSEKTYEDIIKERAYLVTKNQEQVSSSIDQTVHALIVWSTLAAGLVIIIRKNKDKRNG